MCQKLLLKKVNSASSFAGPTLLNGTSEYIKEYKSKTYRQIKYQKINSFLSYFKNELILLQALTKKTTATQFLIEISW